MKVVFNKTLRNMFKPLIMGIYFTLCIIITVFIIIANKENNSLMVTIPQYIESLRVAYSSLVFLYLGGVGLVILIMLFGLDIFATEEHEGTMRILVAKPVSRSSIILGKTFGLLFGSFVYYISSILLSVTIFSLFIGIDKDVFLGFIKIIPSFILYGIFVIIVFSSLSALLSSLFKKKIPSIIIFVILILAIYGVLPIARIITLQQNVYFSSKLQLIDVNSHLGNVFMRTIEQGKEENEIYNYSLNWFTGRYITDFYDPDIEVNNYNLIKDNDSINTNIVILVYLTLSTLFFIFTYERMTKKDIT